MKRISQSVPSDSSLFSGKYIELRRKGTWEYVRRVNITGIVVIVPVTDANEIVLVEQYRIPVGARVIELPAGLAGDKPGTETEPLSDAAKRELLEETGYACETMTQVSVGPASPGMSDELLTLFKATGLRKVNSGGGDETEDIIVHTVPLDGFENWLDSQASAGKLIDVKVHLGPYFAGRGSRR